MLIGKENEKNTEKGFIVFQHDIWWEFPFSKLKVLNGSSARFEGEYGTVEVYGSFVVLTYSSEKEKEGIMEDYHLPLSQKRK